MSLRAVTPVVITYNEEANLGRTLDSLGWAERVVVLDSGSTDRTEAIARAHPGVELITRPFDNYRNQWNFGIAHAGAGADYVLALDADMAVPERFVAELERAFLPGGFDGGLVSFAYRYHGHPLTGSLCPPQLRLFRPSHVRVEQPGHNHHFEVDGRIYRFEEPVAHDDRKPIDRWLSSQIGYSRLESERARTGGRARDWLRRLAVMPPLAVGLAYVRAGGPLRGAAALRYAYERGVAEAIIALRLLDAKLKHSSRDGEP